MSIKNSNESLLVKLALGAALAVSAGYMFVTHREEIASGGKKKIEQLAKYFHQSKNDIEKRVKKIWGTTSKEAIAAYLDVRGSLLHALENESFKKGEKMLRKRYEEMVDMVLEKATKAGLIEKTRMARLADTLKMDWLAVQKALSKKMAEAMEGAKLKTQSAKTAASGMKKAAVRGQKKVLEVAAKSKKLAVKKVEKSLGKKK